MPIVCMPIARMEAIDRAREALAGARECMIDARAAALRSRVEELAKASFHKDDSLASKTRSHLSVPAQTKVRGLEHGTIVARARTRRAPGVLPTNSAARE